MYSPTRSLKMRHTFSKETREGSLGFFSGPRWEVIFFWLIRQPSVLLCFTTSIPQRARRGRPRWACCRGWMLWPSAGTHNASTFPTHWPGAPSKYSEQKEMPKPQSGDSWTTQGSPFCWARNWAWNSVTAWNEGLLPSDWPVIISMGNFLDCQLMQEGPAQCGQNQSEAVQAM